MIEEFKAFREAYHEDKQEMQEKIAQLEARLEDSEARAAGLKDKLSERTIQYKDALKRIEELLVRITELEEQVGSVSSQRRVGISKGR
jgi:chromosome segregation ATPase